MRAVFLRERSGAPTLLYQVDARTGLLTAHLDHVRTCTTTVTTPAW
ncbi:hypothetical protein M8C13_05220 [Crossiella sp. SN42]|nr:hypothetical protein [Crossiella sp. SN42]MCO1575159.1 hypothetical protein [Crossiella sp. SN42]